MVFPSPVDTSQPQVPTKAKQSIILMPASNSPTLVTRIEENDLEVNEAVTETVSSSRTAALQKLDSFVWLSFLVFLVVVDLTMFAIAIAPDHGLEWCHWVSLVISILFTAELVLRLLLEGCRLFTDLFSLLDACAIIASLATEATMKTG